VFRNFAAILALCVTTGGFAAPIIIEGFDDLDDPANWQINLTQNHTLNASTTGNVPQLVTSGTANYAGRFLVNWQTPAVAGTANPYNAADGLTYFAARFNINAPGSLPNNNIPTSGGLLQADITNESSFAVQVALVVDAVGSSQLERGPLVTVPALGSITYSWDFNTQPPVGFDTGDGAFFGAVQRVKSLLVYSATAPAGAQTSLLVDNIRDGSGIVAPLPDTPVVKSLLKSATAGEAVLSWNPSTNPSVTGYNIYVASDANFGSPTVNRLSFPPAPAKSVGASVNSTTLQGLTAGQNIYVAVAATDGTEISELSQAYAIRLPSAGGVVDRIVLDNDAFGPTSPEFQAKGYAHAAVYTAQALGSLGRSYETVSAASIESGAAALAVNEQGVVVWSNLLDGAVEPSITATNLTKISSFVNAGGNIIVSGTNVGDQLAGAGSPLQTHLHASLLSSHVGLSDITPVRALSAVAPFSTACNPATNAVAYATAANDALVANSDSIELALYTGVPRNGGVAGIGHNKSLVLLGFAFESAGDPAGSAASQTRRKDLMGRMIDYLLIPTAAQDWQLYAE
jgi:hypothetical protein